MYWLVVAMVNIVWRGYYKQTKKGSLPTHNYISWSSYFPNSFRILPYFPSLPSTINCFFRRACKWESRKWQKNIKNKHGKVKENMNEEWQNLGGRGKQKDFSFQCFLSVGSPSVVDDIWSTMFNWCYKTVFFSILRECHVTTLWGKHCLSLGFE